MEDFEYSVEICERDWECFFAECEECNLLSPSLAGVDDSGMSDMDDAASILGKSLQRVEHKSGLSEARSCIDGPQASPVDHYLSKHGIGGMESLLSGSEEDIHSQSVNKFFERMKSLTDAESAAEPSQVQGGNIGEAKLQEELCNDGRRASADTLPKSIPKLNDLPASKETAVGTVSSIFHELAANNKTNITAHPEIELVIIEEACTLQNQCHDSLDTAARSVIAPNTVTKANTCTCLGDVRRGSPSSQPTLCKACDADSNGDPEMGTAVKCKEESANVSHLNATGTGKVTSQESSPSASVKRKRRKKRRASSEPAESGFGCERQVPVKKSDSEEEQCAWRGGRAPNLPEDICLLASNPPPKHAMSTSPSCSLASNLPLTRSDKDVNLSNPISPCGSQRQYSPESVVKQGGCETSAGENPTDDRLLSAISALGDSAPLRAETPNIEGKRDDAGGRQAPGEMNRFIAGRENVQHLKSCTAQVKPPPQSISPSVDSSGPAGDDSQSDTLAATKSAVAAEVGHSGGDKHTQCPGEAEPQQQLEIHNVDQDSCASESPDSPLSATAALGSEGQILTTDNIEPRQFKTTASPSHEIPPQEIAPKLTPSSDASRLCTKPSTLSSYVSAQETEHPLETLSKLATLSERAESATAQIVCNGNPHRSGDSSAAGNSERKTNPDLSLSEDVLRPSSLASSCCALDAGSTTSLSKEDIAETLLISCSSVGQNDSAGKGENASLALARPQERDASTCPKCQPASPDTTEPTCDLAVAAGDVVSRSPAELEKSLDSKHTVFAMSSFWSEMEKLTIKDILGLRMVNESAAHSPLGPLQEIEESDMLALTDSGFFTQQDECKLEQTEEDAISDAKSRESNAGSVTGLDSLSSGCAMWESESLPAGLAADAYPKTMMLTSINDAAQPGLSGGAPKCLRKISKNISVHNLRALESKSYSCKWAAQPLQTLGEAEPDKVEYLTDGHISATERDCSGASAAGSYRISFSDIFEYLFGGKRPITRQSSTDNIAAFNTGGNSVPETYDHFFSEFDTESFFCPLSTEDDQGKLVPIFSCSRSTNTHLQFPEAYDYFFASSSSDESSDEEDDERCSPLRVVTRFSQTAKAAQITTDVYDNFFTDSDVMQNFFWNTTLSFRNLHLSRSAVEKPSPSPTPLRQSCRALRRTIRPLNALGNQDFTAPDPLLYHLEDRISRQLAQQPLPYQELQVAVSNPRLDASVLPLRQSDMCLVCIAFASWVLKTANPQVGDAWKAVLLANVSALSAIRYLRKYVKVEAAAGQKKLHHTASSDSLV